MDVDADKLSLEPALPGVSPASQTLVRGLDVLEQVAEGPAALSAIARALGLSRSTVHRLATTLLERRYLNANPRRGYSLGPKLLELGWLARDQISLVRLARPYLETLAAQTGDVALLALRDQDSVLIADQAAGRRRVLPSLRTGDRLRLTESALGRALLLPADGAAAPGPGPGDGPAGVIIDCGESEPEICTIAVAVRGADGTVHAALGIAAATTCVDPSDLSAAVEAVADAAADMAGELGWRSSIRALGGRAPHGHAAVPFTLSGGTQPGAGQTAQGLRGKTAGAPANNKTAGAPAGNKTAGAPARGTPPRVLAAADSAAEGERDRMEGPKP